MRYESIISAGLAALLFAACGGDGDGLLCGDGTQEVGGECAVISADAGAALSDPADRRPCDEPFGPVAAGALLVDGSYTGTDSDGSSERPFTTIQAAIDAASSGQEVGIATGVYAENLTIDAALRIEGRCANDVIVEGGIRVQDTGGVAIRGLTVRDGSPGILAENVQPEGAAEFGLSVQYVRATGNVGAGLEMNASAVEIVDSEFTRTAEVPGGDVRQLGSGLFINNGSLFDVTTSIFGMNGFMAVDVADATGQPLRVKDEGPATATATAPSTGIFGMNGVIGNEGGGVRIGGAPSGLLAPTDAPLVQIISNDFANNDGDAIQVFSARANIIGNSLKGTGTQALAGIRAESVTGTIGSNQIENFPEGGILLINSQGLAIANNTLTENFDVGILSFNGRGISLSGNLVSGTKGNPEALGTGHGIYIASDGVAENVGAHDLTSNTVSDNEGVGIAVNNLQRGDEEERIVTMFSNTVARNALMGIDLQATRAVGMFGNALIDNTGYGLRCIDGPGAVSRVFFDDNIVKGTLESGSGLDGDGIVMSNCHVSVDLNTINGNARNGVVLDVQTDGGCDNNEVTGHAANGAGVFDIRLHVTSVMNPQGNTLAVEGTANGNSDLNLTPVAPPGV